MIKGGRFATLGGPFCASRRAVLRPPEPLKINCTRGAIKKTMGAKPPPGPPVIRPLLLSFVDGLVHFTEINYCGMRIDRYSLPDLTSVMPQFMYLFQRNKIRRNIFVN